MLILTIAVLAGGATPRNALIEYSGAVVHKPSLPAYVQANNDRVTRGPSSAETFWHPAQPGCFKQSIHDTLYDWEGSKLSVASFRFGISPDTGKGPTTLIIIDSGKEINLGQPDKSPVFMAIIGDNKRSCVVHTSLNACPQASEVYKTLQTTSIPLGFEMSSSIKILVFHAPTYFLEFRDGQGNHNQWRFYGTSHPLQAVIDDSISVLKAYWKPALDFYSDYEN